MKNITEDIVSITYEVLEDGQDAIDVHVRGADGFRAMVDSAAADTGKLRLTARVEKREQKTRVRKRGGSSLTRGGLWKLARKSGGRNSGGSNSESYDTGTDVIGRRYFQDIVTFVTREAGESSVNELFNETIGFRAGVKDPHASVERGPSRVRGGGLWTTVDVSFRAAR